MLQLTLPVFINRKGLAIDKDLPSNVVTSSNDDESGRSSSSCSSNKGLLTNQAVGVSFTKLRRVISSSRVPGVNRILLVDDSLPNRKMTARLLKSRGYAVEEANDGIEAVEKVEGSITGSVARFDVILMDSEMPRMSGPVATETIRQNGYRGLIVGVTGNVMQQEVDIFISKGANKVLFKPLDMFKLEIS